MQGLVQLSASRKEFHPSFGANALLRILIFPMRRPSPIGIGQCRLYKSSFPRVCLQPSSKILRYIALLIEGKEHIYLPKACRAPFLGAIMGIGAKQLFLLVLVVSTMQPLLAARPLLGQHWWREGYAGLLLSKAFMQRSLSSSGPSNCTSDPSIRGGNCPH